MNPERKISAKQLSRMRKSEKSFEKMLKEIQPYVRKSRRVVDYKKLEWKSLRD